jgi:hypothetical protein
MSNSTSTSTSSRWAARSLSWGVIGCAPRAHPLGLRAALHVDLVERPPRSLVRPPRTR